MGFLSKAFGGVMKSMGGIAGIAGPLLGGVADIYSARTAAKNTRANQERNYDWEDSQRVHSNAFEVAQQEKNFQFQKDHQRRSMDYNKSMSDTAWERGVQDMRKAGLNPALAFSQGGASAPQVSGGGGASARGIAGKGGQGSVNQTAQIGSTAQRVQQQQNAYQMGKQIEAQTFNIEANSAATIANSWEAINRVKTEKKYKKSIGIWDTIKRRLNPFSKKR